MRITMICIGSTGDVRPYLVLGRELRRRGHEVSICAFANFASAVKAEGLVGESGKSWAAAGVLLSQRI